VETESNLPVNRPLNTTGNEDTASGAGALASNTTGSNNTASGLDALTSNTTGNDNTANGFEALFTNDTGFDNVASGVGALFANTAGFDNTASGSFALTANTTGANNTAGGLEALASNTVGNNNTATGAAALLSNTTGQSNTCVGTNAHLSNTTGNSNIAIGESAGTNLTTGSNNIDIGNVGAAGDSKFIRIGTKLTHRATFIAGISGATIPTGIAVIIDTDGHLGTITSSARFKEAIKPMDKASEAILALQPVTFRYKRELDPDGIPQFGLVAEDVEKVNPALVARDEQGKPYTVRYEAVNAMLLNEFLKEHRKVEEQQATIAQLKSTVAQQQKGFEAKLAKQEEQIETLVAGLQKVSAHLEANKPAPQVVKNP
jgi:hypothetical protein